MNKPPPNKHSPARDFAERLDASALVLDAIGPAPQDIRAHLAAVAWWRIVECAETKKNGAELALKNAIEGFATRRDWTNGVAVSHIRAAIAHYVATIPPAVSGIVAALPLRAVFSAATGDKFDALACREFVKLRVTDRATRSFLLAAIAGEVEADPEFKHKFTPLEGVE